jgi:hypothetical protein
MVLSDVINDSYNGKQVFCSGGCGLINYILSLCSYSVNHSTYLLSSVIEDLLYT